MSRLRDRMFQVDRRLGFRSFPSFPDVTDEDVGIITQVRPYTATSPERILAVLEATRHVVRARIPGAFVECGVYRGGSMMAAARGLLQMGDTSRDLYLYDTFSGMVDPSAADVDYRGRAAGDLLRSQPRREGNDWTIASQESVRRNMAMTAYPPHRVHIVAGPVEQTLPDKAPKEIALLRLDTDWYESTRHELAHLYPRLVSGGVLIIDDYGHWQGARKAVDEYFKEQAQPLLLNRIDYTGRIGVKR